MFRGTFLSNFWPCEIRGASLVYPSVEHAYQAAKTLDTAQRQWIALAPTPAEAKSRGRRVTQRADWGQVRLSAMRAALAQKFAPGSDLARQLLATGTSELVERNTWHDTFWGVCQCTRCGNRGENHLGRLLTERRLYLLALGR